MKKIGMSILALGLIAGVGTFILLNNQAHCAETNNCFESQLSQTGTVLSYSESELQNALSRGDKLGFFFEASWCANCKLLTEDLITRGIPDGATVLIVDFDKASELRAKYGVNNLHTIVLVDQNLNLISKDESGDYEKLVKMLQ